MTGILADSKCSWTTCLEPESGAARKHPQSTARSGVETSAQREVNGRKKRSERGGPSARCTACQTSRSGSNKSSSRGHNDNCIQQLSIGPSIKDLCDADRARIAALVEELAQLEEAKEEADSRLRGERELFESQTEALSKERAVLLAERDQLQEQLAESQHLLMRMQEGVVTQLNHVTSHTASVDSLSAFSRSSLPTRAIPRSNKIGFPQHPQEGAVLSDRFPYVPHPHILQDSQSPGHHRVATHDAEKHMSSREFYDLLEREHSNSYSQRRLGDLASVPQERFQSTNQSVLNAFVVAPSSNPVPYSTTAGFDQQPLEELDRAYEQAKHDLFLKERELVLREQEVVRMIHSQQAGLSQVNQRLDAVKDMSLRLESCSRASHHLDGKSVRSHPGKNAPHLTQDGGPFRENMHQNRLQSSRPRKKDKRSDMQSSEEMRRRPSPSLISISPLALNSTPVLPPSEHSSVPSTPSSLRHSTTLVVGSSSEDERISPITLDTGVTQPSGETRYLKRTKATSSVAQSQSDQNVHSSGQCRSAVLKHTGAPSPPSSLLDLLESMEQDIYSSGPGHSDSDLHSVEEEDLEQRESEIMTDLFFLKL